MQGVFAGYGITGTRNPLLNLGFNNDRTLFVQTGAVNYKGPTNSQGYQIVAGERRWRAAQIAQLHDLPVIIRDMTDTEVLEIALIENIQREDLNPLEEAQGLQRLTQEFGLTHELAAQAVGRSRSAASNLLRLLQLAEPVQQLTLF